MSSTSACPRDCRLTHLSSSIVHRTTPFWQLRSRARRCRLKVLETFAIAVSEALLLGAPLTETLSAQSREIRSAHRAEVERQIERAPVKLLIPTGTLILPALLLSILGPFAAASGMW